MDRVVHIDTNLDTHFLITLTDFDTVFDFKKKIKKVHMECFQEFGKIKINALKVKRKGFFYHLSDSMLIKNAFGGAKEDCFLSVDASIVKLPTENKIPNKTDFTNQLALICFPKASSGDSSIHQFNHSSKRTNETFDPGNNDQKDLEMEVKNVVSDHCPESDYTCDNEGLSERLVVLETNAKLKGGESQFGVGNIQYNKSPESSVRSESGVTKNRKSKKKDKIVASKSTLKDDDDIDDINPLGGSLKDETGENKRRKFKKTEDTVSMFPVKVDDVDKHSLDKIVTEVPVDAALVNTGDVKAPGNASLEDTSLRFFQKPVETRDDMYKDLVFEAQGNAPPEEASESVLASRKRKRRKSERSDNPQEVNSETPIKNDTASKSGVIVKQKNITAATEKLKTETPENLVVATSSSGIEKQRKKRRSRRDQESFVEPYSCQNAGEARCEENGFMKIDKKIVENITMHIDEENAMNVVNDIDKTSDSAIASETDVLLARPSPAVIDMEVTENDVANVEVKSAAPNLGSVSRSEGTKTSKKRHSNKTSKLPIPTVAELGNMEEDVVLAVGGDFDSDDRGIKISGPDKVREQRESVQNCDTKEMVLEIGEQFIHGELGSQSRDDVALVNLSKIKININVEPEKSAGRKRSKKRAKKPVLGKAVSASDFVTTAPQNLNVEAEKTSHPLSRTEIVKPPFMTDANGEGNGLSKNEEESDKNEGNEQKALGKEAAASSHVKEEENKINLPQQNLNDTIPYNTEVSAAKPTKKMKKSRNAAGVPASAIKKQEVDAEELIAANDRNREVEDASKTEKLAKSSSKKQSAGKDMEPKHIGDGHDSLASEAGSTQARSSKTHNVNPNKQSLEYFDEGVQNPNVTDTNCRVDVLKSEYFSPCDKEREAPTIEPPTIELVGNQVQKLQKTDMTVKAKKSTRVSVADESDKKSHLKKSNVVEHKDAKRETLRVEKEIEQKVGLRNNLSTAAKSSSKRVGEVVNSSGREKSLLAASAAIFQGHSSDSSEDSDTSTKAPSDNSSSSSDSEDDRADSARGEDYGKSKKEMKTPNSKDMDMNSILRSSIRYKKAMLSAAQSQLEDTESQPVDFVPDSQPN